MQYLTTFRSTVYRSPDFNVVAEVVAEAKHQIEQNRVESFFSTKKRCLKKNSTDLLQRTRQNASKRQGIQPSHLILTKIKRIKTPWYPTISSYFFEIQLFIAYHNFTKFLREGDQGLNEHASDDHHNCKAWHWLKSRSGCSHVR